LITAAAAAGSRLQLRLRPQYHFPVTLGFHEVIEILIPERDHNGRETDFFKNSFATSGSRKVWERYVAKLQKYKALAAQGGAEGAPAGAQAAGMSSQQPAADADGAPGAGLSGSAAAAAAEAAGGVRPEMPAEADGVDELAMGS
jgi:hypothetical protein